MATKYGSARVSDRDTSNAIVGRTAARYLRAIASESTGTDERVTTGALREAVGVTPASASEMIARLADRGFVEYEKYRGVRLTERGATAAASVAWRVCIVTTYFESALDAPLDDGMAVDIAVTLPEDGVATLRDRVDPECADDCPGSVPTREQEAVG